MVDAISARDEEILDVLGRRGHVRATFAARVADGARIYEYEGCFEYGIEDA